MTNKKLEFLIKYLAGVIIWIFCFSYHAGELKRRKAWDLLGTFMGGTALLIVLIALIPSLLSLFDDWRSNAARHA